MGGSPCLRWPLTAWSSTSCHLNSNNFSPLTQANNSTTVGISQSSNPNTAISATMSSTEATPAGDAKDNSYVSRTGQNQIPVQKDEAPVADPINPATANTDEQLGQFYLPLPSVLLLSHIFSVRYVTDPSPSQPVTTPKPSTPTTLSTADALAVPSPVGHTPSRATRRGCLRMTGRRRQGRCLRRAKALWEST